MPTICKPLYLINVNDTQVKLNIIKCDHSPYMKMLLCFDERFLYIAFRGVLNVIFLHQDWKSKYTSIVET